MKIPKTAKQIKNSKDYIDIDGTIYSIHGKNRGSKFNTVFKKTQHLNNACGYMYAGIKYNDRNNCTQRRVNRLVAETFIPNPNNLPVVGHKNNIKTDNRIENLYWTTYSENSQKSVNDGLLVNDKGYEDSQSKPVNMYDSKTNKLLASYGSILEAVRETKIPQSTISRQAKYKRPVRKPFYFRYQDDPSCNTHSIIAEYDFNTDRLLATFFSVANASKETGICSKTISQQINLNRKPFKSKSGVYFKILF